MGMHTLDNRYVIIVVGLIPEGQGGTACLPDVIESRSEKTLSL